MEKPNFHGILDSIKKIVVKRSPEILTGIGIAGMITTTVLAVQATPKAIDLIRDKEDELEVEKLTIGETIKATWKCYIPTAFVSLSTITCILGANSLSKRSQAALISAYSLLDRSFKEYKETTNDIYGKDADKKIREAIAKNNYSKIKTYKNTPYLSVFSLKFTNLHLMATRTKLHTNLQRIYNIKNSMDKNNHNPTSQHMNFHITF